MSKPFLRPFLRELPAALILISFVLFWLRAESFRLTSYSLFRLELGLLINLPLMLALAPRGLGWLKKRFAGPSGPWLIVGYLFVTALHAAALVAFGLHPAIYKAYLATLFALMPYYLWFPLCAVGLAYLLFRKKADHSIDAKVILFLIILLPLAKLGMFIHKMFVHAGVFTYYYQLQLLAFKVEGAVDYLELRELWKSMVPVILLFMGAVSLESLNLNRSWDRRAMKVCFCFCAYILLIRILAISDGRAVFASSSWLWNLATGFYPQPMSSVLLEEILLHGVLQTWLSARLARFRFGEFSAILLTALLFGINHYPYIHVNWYQAAFGGALYGWSYSMTRNLWVPITIHGVNNITIDNIFVPV